MTSVFYCNYTYSTLLGVGISISSLNVTPLRGMSNLLTYAKAQQETGEVEQWKVLTEVHEDPAAQLRNAYSHHAALPS